MAATPDTPKYGSRILLAIIIVALAGLALLTRHDHDGRPAHGSRQSTPEIAANLAKIAAFNASVIALTREADDALQALRTVLGKQNDDSAPDNSNTRQEAVRRYQATVSRLQVALDQIDTPGLILKGHERSLRDSKRQLAEHFSARMAYAEKLQRLADRGQYHSADPTTADEPGKPSRSVRILMRLQDPYLALGYDTNDIDCSTMTLKPGSVPITRLPD